MPALRDIKVNEKVFVGKKRQIGRVRYVGPLKDGPGTWYGVAYTKPIGENDGSKGGKKYFRCPTNHGVFVRRKALEIFSYESMNTDPSHTGRSGISKWNSSQASKKTSAIDNRKPSLERNRAQLLARKEQLQATLEELAAQRERVENEITKLDVLLENVGEKEQAASVRSRYSSSQFRLDVYEVVKQCAQLRNRGVAGGQEQTLYQSRWDNLLNSFMEERWGSYDDVKYFRDELIARRYTGRASAKLEALIDVIWGPDRPYYAVLSKRHAREQGIDPDDITRKSEGKSSASKEEKSDGEEDSDVAVSSSEDDSEEDAKFKSESPPLTKTFKKSNTSSSSSAMSFLAKKPSTEKKPSFSTRPTSSTSGFGILASKPTAAEPPTKPKPESTAPSSFKTLAAKKPEKPISFAAPSFARPPTKPSASASSSQKSEPFKIRPFKKTTTTTTTSTTKIEPFKIKPFKNTMMPNSNGSSLASSAAPTPVQKKDDDSYDDDFDLDF